MFAPFHYIFQNRRSIALENRLCLRTDFQILSPFRGELRMNLYVYCASPVREYRRNRYSGRAMLAPTNSFKCAGKAFAPIQNNSCALTTPQSAYGCQLPLRRGANGVRQAHGFLRIFDTGLTQRTYRYGVRAPPKKPPLCKGRRSALAEPVGLCFQWRTAALTDTVITGARYRNSGTPHIVSHSVCAVQICSAHL